MVADHYSDIDSLGIFHAYDYRHDAARGYQDVKPNLIQTATLVLAISSVCPAQASPRIPLVGYEDRSGNVVEPATHADGWTSFKGDWVAIYKDGKAGYLNLRTKASTGLIFDQVTDDNSRALFADGPEPVRMDRKWGFADTSGRIVIPPQFDGAKGFGPDGLAIVKMADAGGNHRGLMVDAGGYHRGFIDKTGNIVVAIVGLQYEPLHRYSGGLAVFQLNNRWGAIDRQGREVIPPRFGFLGEFADNGLAPASLDGGIRTPGSRFGYVDRAGRFIIPETYSYAGSFSPAPADGERAAPQGLAQVRLASGEDAYIDAAGNLITRFPAGVATLGISPNNLVRFRDRTTKNYGFADKTGSIAIPARFQQLGEFDMRGLAMAQENGKAGYIRADGSWAIQPRFSSAGSFDAFGQAQAIENGQTELIDETGHKVATLRPESRFTRQQGDYAAFMVYPPQIDYPVEQFGRWTLERRLYAVTEDPSMLTPTGFIRLTFRTNDGLVRWSVWTEGRAVDLITELGPDKEPDERKKSQLDNFPPRPDEVIALLGRQLAGKAQSSFGVTPANPSDLAAQFERYRHIGVNRSEYLAELDGSAPDLDRALKAMQVRIGEQFGKLYAMPSIPL